MSFMFYSVHREVMRTWSGKLNFFKKKGIQGLQFKHCMYDHEQTKKVNKTPTIVYKINILNKAKLKKM